MKYTLTLHSISKKYENNPTRPLLIRKFTKKEKTHSHALKNISFKVKKGEVVGLIGPNGSGKSTLLKIISGITTPTKGTISSKGRIGSLIELGAGFNPDLTGKENVYTNGALLGFTKEEMDNKYPLIEKFADIGEYINQPTRTFSSGMAARLGFAVAIHLNPDILLVDEVLSVGDMKFQEKCLRKIAEYKKQKKTILFVSHDLLTVRNICSRVIVLNHGKIVCDGEPSKAINYYYQSSHQTSSESKNAIGVR